MASNSRGDADVQWSVNGILNGNADVGTVDNSGHYTAPSSPQGGTATVTVTSLHDPTKSVSATVNIVGVSAVATTSNPLVASYTVASPIGANVSVQFGPDTTYAFATSQQQVTAGSPLSILVAGMRASSTYHMRAMFTFADGSKYDDPDQTFTTGAIPANILPSITATTTPGMTPQPGVELLSVIAGPMQAFATDLGGNVIWYYGFQPTAPTNIQPITLMSNGHLLVVLSPNSTTPLSGPIPPGTLNSVREIDLAGNTIREITIDDLNTKLAAAGFALTALTFHHEALPLANGHWIVLTNTIKQVTNLNGYTGPVLGDVIVGLDTNLNPVWAWNQFDHLDITRQPFGIPDWTHSNAIIYSPDDGNLIISIRHQSWLVKMNYANGQGDGSVIWKLGYQGDFQMLNGTDPTDWFYMQHAPAFFSKSTAGKFSIGAFGNGNYRFFPSGVTCGTTGNPPCQYSNVPIFQVDETAKTATLTFNQTTPMFSFFGGNVTSLANGNVEYDQCASGTGPVSDIYEVLQTTAPQTVWHLNYTGAVSFQNVYRGRRLPSLYPGVQW